MALELAQTGLFTVIAAVAITFITFTTFIAGSSVCCFVSLSIWVSRIMIVPFVFVCCFVCLVGWLVGWLVFLAVSVLGRFVFIPSLPHPCNEIRGGKLESLCLSVQILS